MERYNKYKQDYKKHVTVNNKHNIDDFESPDGFKISQNGTGGLPGWLPGSLAAWLAGWLADGIVGRLEPSPEVPAWLASWLPGWLDG